MIASFIVVLAEVGIVLIPESSRREPWTDRENNGTVSSLFPQLCVGGGGKSETAAILDEGTPTDVLISEETLFILLLGLLAICSVFGWSTLPSFSLSISCLLSSFLFIRLIFESSNCVKFMNR